MKVIILSIFVLEWLPATAIVRQRHLKKICSPQEWPAGQWFITGTKRLGASKTAVHTSNCWTEHMDEFCRNQKWKTILQKYCCWQRRLSCDWSVHRPGKSNRHLQHQPQRQGPQHPSFVLLETYVCQDVNGCCLPTRCQIIEKTWQKWLPAGGAGIEYSRPFAPRKTVEWSMKVFAKPRRAGRWATRKISAKSHFNLHPSMSMGGIFTSTFLVGKWSHFYWLTAGNQFLSDGANSWGYLGTENTGLSPWMHQDTAWHPPLCLTSKNTPKPLLLQHTPGCHTVIGHLIGGFACLYAAAQNTPGLHYKIVSLAALLLCSSSWKIF